MRGTRLFQFGYFKRFSHHFCHYFGWCDLAVPFRDRSEHLDHLDIPMALIVKPVEAALGCYCDQWGFIQVGVCHTRDQVGGSGSECSKTHSSSPRQTAPNICYKSGPLFMPAGNKFYGGGLNRKKERSEEG